MNEVIYVGVDGSLAARTAVAWASDRAASLGADLVLVHVVDDEWGAVGQSAMAELRDTGAQCLDREVELARARWWGENSRAVLLEGNPMLELATLSEHADLVVVGTHKGGYVRGRYFGSRGLQLAATTSSALAVIPQSPVKERRGITVGVDPSHPAMRAVTFAAREAVITGQQLTLLQAGSADDDQATRDLATGLLTEARAAEQRAHLRRVEHLAAEALADATIMSALVVTGRPTRPGAHRGLGHVNHDLLVNLAGPVVIVPD